MSGDPSPAPVDRHPPAEGEPTIDLTVDGAELVVADRGETLLDLLHRLGRTSVKDGCSPQGQCGCCTVHVDGAPRVACVTPARRVRGRRVMTLDGLDPERRQAWADALVATGGSQCGFCTPGIVMRLEAAGLDGADAGDADDPALRGRVDQALLAHLCRCTGWQTIREAAVVIRSGRASTAEGSPPRDLVAAGRRATIEGRADQIVDPVVPMGAGGFAVDTVPDDHLVAVPDDDGEWVLGTTIADARARATKTQGRRTTIDPTWPLEVPALDGAVATLRTTWVEPAPLEPDAAWCWPGGDPVGPLTNGGAFGAKETSEVAAVARRLADEETRTVLAVASREHAVRSGPKRPPVAGAVRADGSGILRIVRTRGIADAIRRVAPNLEVEEVDVPGPPTSTNLRAAGWAEALVLTAATRPDPGVVESPDGARARAEIVDGTIRVAVRCGDPLDEVTLRSYCIGAAHMAWSWVSSEAIAVDADGAIHDLTIRSFGIARAVDTPPIEIEIEPDDGPPVNGSDAVFAAVASAAWVAAGLRQDWPVGAIIQP